MWQGSAFSADIPLNNCDKTDTERATIFCFDEKNCYVTSKNGGEMFFYFVIRLSQEIIYGSFGLGWNIILVSLIAVIKQ